MKHIKAIPTQLELQQLFNYVEINGRGHLQWRVSRGGQKKGTIAGYINDNGKGYKVEKIKINGSLYRTPRLVQTLLRGDIPTGLLVDHIDGNSLNNNLCNLQLLTQSENRQKG